MYEAKKVTDPRADLSISSPLWEHATRSPRFVNIVNARRATLATQAAVLWTDRDLLVRYWLEEPHIAATMTERDSLLFNENNVELFVEGDGVYYELEVNALNVVYEVLFAWKDQWESVHARFPELDPLADAAFTFGGNNDRTPSCFWVGTHPRGVRWAFTDWDLPGLQTEVRLHGTINDPDDRDRGWDVLIRLPWESLTRFRSSVGPPRARDEWRFQFARYERLDELSASVGWAWSPVGDTDNHVPEKFTLVRFVDDSL